MWLRYHSDGTVLVHGSLAVGCHSSLSCPAVPTNEYHGFNNSKRSYSIHVCLCIYWSASLIPGLFPRWFLGCGAKKRKLHYCYTGNCPSSPRNRTCMSLEWTLGGAGNLKSKQIHCLDAIHSYYVLMSLGQDPPSESAFSLNVGFLLASFLCLVPCYRSARSTWRTPICFLLGDCWWPLLLRIGTYTSALLCGSCLSLVSDQPCE